MCVFGRLCDVHKLAVRLLEMTAMPKSRLKGGCSYWQLTLWQEVLLFAPSAELLIWA